MTSKALERQKDKCNMWFFDIYKQNSAYANDNHGSVSHRQIKILHPCITKLLPRKSATINLITQISVIVSRLPITTKNKTQKKDKFSNKKCTLEQNQSSSVQTKTASFKEPIYATSCLGFKCFGYSMGDTLLFLKIKKSKASTLLKLK